MLCVNENENEEGEREKGIDGKEEKTIAKMDEQEK